MMWASTAFISRALFDNISVRRFRSSGARFEYPEQRMFAYAYSVVDIQLQHSTRVSIPGLAFQHEPGWYLDLGFDAPTAAPESWFSVQALIAGGR